MPTLPPNDRQLLRQRTPQFYPDRGTRQERGYDASWQRSRKLFLASSPLCIECLKDGRTEAATVVDHIIPHRGNARLFWDINNWQALCERHHNLKTGRGE